MVETLAKPWGPHKAGTQITKDPTNTGPGVVLVSALRWANLRDSGFFGTAAAVPAQPPEGGA